GELHARVLEAEALDVGREADRHQHLAGLDRALCAVLAGVGDGDLVARVLDGLDLRAGEDLDAELLVLAGDLLRDIRILVGEGPVEELDDRALHAVVGQHVGELHADGAGADDDDRLGDVAVEDLLLEADHVAAQLDARKQPHLRPGRDDRVVERDLLGGAVGLGDGDRVRAGERAASFVLGHLVLLHEEVDALDVRLRDLAAAIPRGAEVEVHVTRDAEQVGLGREDVRQIRVAQQRLGGDASDVQADAAPVLLFDDRDRLAQLGGADRRDVAAGTGTEDDDVVMSHALQPSRLRGPPRRCPPAAGGAPGPPRGGPASPADRRRPRGRRRAGCARPPTARRRRTWSPRRPGERPRWASATAPWWARRARRSRWGWARARERPRR